MTIRYHANAGRDGDGAIRHARVVRSWRALRRDVPNVRSAPL
jgi:hypothetical protein